MSEETEVLKGWNLEVGAYYHECGEKMICLVRRDRTGYLVLSEVPIFCSRCDSTKTVVDLITWHVLNILNGSGKISDSDFKKAHYLIMRAFEFMK
jgi:hypothetical protein